MAVPEFHKGNGGYVQPVTVAVDSSTGLPTTNPPAETADPTKITHIGKWMLTVMTNLAENTNSGTAGCVTRVATTTDGSGTLSIPRDFAHLPSAAGITNGASLWARFKLGDSTKYHLVPIIVESVKTDNDNTQGIVTEEIAFKINGQVYYNQPIS